MILIKLILITCLFWQSLSHCQRNPELEVYIKNEFVRIPMDDQQFCVDTIVFVFENNTDTDYYFAIQDSGIFFSDESFDKKEFYSNPFHGVAVRFLTKENKVLQVITTEGIIENFPEDPDITPIQDIRHIPKNKISEFKMTLKFPKRSSFGAMKEYVENLDEAVNFEIRFEPIPHVCESYFQDYNLQLDENSKYLSISKSFLLPVKHDCN